MAVHSGSKRIVVFGTGFVGKMVIAELVKHPGRVRDALADAVRRCVNDDGAQAVIIGGGPLGEAARELQPMFPQPIIQPIPAATRLILGGLRP